jgi:hypothetical protein
MIRWLACGALIFAMAGLAACGDDDDDDGGEATTSTTAEEIVINTHITFKPDEVSGEVLDTSTLGDSSFCPGGTFSDKQVKGPWFIEKTIECTDGTLIVGFSPQDPIGNKQRGAWEALSGTGAYEGLEGGGRMEATFESPDAREGQETFTGEVTP